MIHVAALPILIAVALVCLVAWLDARAQHRHYQRILAQVTREAMRDRMFAAAAVTQARIDRANRNRRSV